MTQSPCANCEWHLGGGKKDCDKCRDCKDRLLYHKNLKDPLWEAVPITQTLQADSRRPVRNGLQYDDGYDGGSKVCCRAGCALQGAEQDISEFYWHKTLFQHDRTCKTCRRKNSLKKYHKKKNVRKEYRTQKTIESFRFSIDNLILDCNAAEELERYI